VLEITEDKLLKEARKAMYLRPAHPIYPYTDCLLVGTATLENRNKVAQTLCDEGSCYCVVHNTSAEVGDQTNCTRLRILDNFGQLHDLSQTLKNFTGCTIVLKDSIKMGCTAGKFERIPALIPSAVVAV
jgi:hypothetical protein